MNATSPQMPTPDAASTEHDIRRQELEIERLTLFLDFARFGFYGTLGGGVAGILLLAWFATLQAFTDFSLNTWGYAVIAGILAAAVAAFGYFSLWSLPRIAARFKDFEVSLRGPCE